MSSEKLNAAIAALERCLDSLKAESTGTPVRAVAGDAPAWVLIERDQWWRRLLAWFRRLDY
jgi:hypothetical protein